MYVDNSRGGSSLNWQNSFISDALDPTGPVHGYPLTVYVVPSVDRWCVRLFTDTMIYGRSWLGIILFVWTGGIIGSKRRLLAGLGSRYWFSVVDRWRGSSRRRCRPEILTMYFLVLSIFSDPIDISGRVPCDLIWPEVRGSIPEPVPMEIF